MIALELLIVLILIGYIYSCQLCRARMNISPLTPRSPLTLKPDIYTLPMNSNDNLKDMMIKSVKWYKNTLSPLMPPNCRFLPTCSSYSIEAIELYGPWKGGMLTAWRIIRCNPTGGSGYDPPQWPPPSYFAGSNSKKWFWMAWKNNRDDMFYNNSKHIFHSKYHIRGKVLLVKSLIFVLLLIGICFSTDAAFL